MTECAIHETWSISKPAVRSKGGIVASAHHRASEIGAGVLREGGNAVDAAVATSFALSVLEPWMSGLGGGGYLLFYDAHRERVSVVEAAMVAPARLDPANYPLAGGTDEDLFGWPAVVDDRNVRGYGSFALPGLVAGLALALERFGTRSWSKSLAPVIELAREGLTADWYATLHIANNARFLARFPESAGIFLPDGHPPTAGWTGEPPRLALGCLPDTLRRLARDGPAAFYEGEIAEDMVADISAGGGILSEGDFRTYRARAHAAAEGRYRDARIFVAPGLSGGPSLLRALSSLAARSLGSLEDEPALYEAYVDCLIEAYSHRLDTMGASAGKADSECTTHLSVVDRDGNMVALTQTLLSVFGSKVVLPRTGILMNNGLMWFDPRPHRPNSLAPGTRPLSNMCPVIACSDEGWRLAAGASGGRRIFPALFQLLSALVDLRLSLDRAMIRPRVDVSGGETVTCDNRLGKDVLARLAMRAVTRSAPSAVYPNAFASVHAVTRDAEGINAGAAHIRSPWAAACSEHP